MRVVLAVALAAFLLLATGWKWGDHGHPSAGWTWDDAGVAVCTQDEDTDCG